MLNMYQSPVKFCNGLITVTFEILSVQIVGLVEVKFLTVLFVKVSPIIHDEEFELFFSLALIKNLSYNSLQIFIVYNMN